MSRQLQIVIALCIALTGATGGYLAAKPEPLVWCCSGDECWVVPLFVDCEPGNTVYYCEYGWSTEASGSDGESGWECLEQ